MLTRRRHPQEGGLSPRVTSDCLSNRIPFKIRFTRWLTAGSRPMHIQQNLLAGLLTILPLAAVWFVLKIVVDVLADIGRPVADWLAATVKPLLPDTIAGVFFNETTLYVTAAGFTLVLLYIVGMVAKRVVGQRMLDSFES